MIMFLSTFFINIYFDKVIRPKKGIPKTGWKPVIKYLYKDTYTKMNVLTATTNLRRYLGKPTHDQDGNPIRTGLFKCLKMVNLHHYYHLFKYEEIDFIALGLLNEQDFISLIDNNDVKQMMVLASFFKGLPIVQQARSG